jgi:hypothetical protein
VVTEDEPHPTIKLGANGTTVCQVNLTGRATTVPFTTLNLGSQRTTTDNITAAAICAASLLCRWRACPIWLWEQEVNSQEFLSQPAIVTVRPQVALLLRTSEERLTARVIYSGRLPVIPHIRYSSGFGSVSRKSTNCSILKNGGNSNSPL